MQSLLLCSWKVLIEILFVGSGAKIELFSLLAPDEKSQMCPGVRMAISQNTGSWATEPWPRCFEDGDGEVQWGRCNRMQGPHLNTNIRNYWFHHVFFNVTQPADCRLGFQHSGHFGGQFLHPVRDALWCCWIFRKSHTLHGSQSGVFISLWTRVLFYLSPPKLCWYPDLDLIDRLSGIFLDFPPCIEH